MQCRSRREDFPPLRAFLEAASPIGPSTARALIKRDVRIGGGYFTAPAVSPLTI